MEAKRKLTVTVFGAGISGLTAAHELAIRGFKVTVIDKEFNECIRGSTLDYGVGGIARSQFFCRPAEEQPEVTHRMESRSRFLHIPRLRPVDDVMWDATLELAPGKATPRSARHATAFFAELNGLLAGKPADLLLAFYRRADDDGKLLAERKKYVRSKTKLSAADFDAIVVVKTVDPADLPPPGMADDVETILDWVTIATSVDVFPGEHGFRFFPSFYRHLFDTMMRTPVIDPFPSEAGIRTVFDNLVPVDEIGFARGDKVRSFVLPRHPVRSLELIRRYLKDITEQLGYTYEDLARFELAMFQYMTSCSERRHAEYEDMSWSALIDVPRFSAIFREHLEYGPQMALGLRGSKSDARTQGNVVTQLLRDQVMPNQHPDATLDGPTSSAWFRHWKDYLITQDVTFCRGTLVEFKGIAATKGGRAQIVPMVELDDEPSAITSDYYVIAFALKDIRDKIDSFIDAAKAAKIALPRDSDPHRIVEFAEVDLDDDLKLARPKGPLQHLAGIQFYFDTELRFWRAHTQYLDSRWSLSSICQPQFWARPRDRTDPYRNLLSVDIGDWDRPYVPPGEHGEDAKSYAPAWEQPPDEIARLTWAQVRDHHDQAFYAKYGERARFPHPIAYALDQRLDCSNPNPKKKIDRGTYLVAKTGRYRLRPGALSNGYDQPKGQSSYVVLERFVFAGTYMKTFTRLTSMESANESARHAVNAILDDATVACERCEIWDVEDHELDDLTWFKDLDRALFRRGLPHFVRTLGWRELPSSVSPDLIELAINRRERP